MSRRLQIVFKAARQLGLRPLALLGLYRLGLRTGWYAHCPRPPRGLPAGMTCRLDAPLPDGETLSARLDADARAAALREAEAVVDGYYRPFGGDRTRLHLTWGADARHWTEFECGRAQPDFSVLPLPHPDIKFLWEPARFTWAFTLGRAWRLSADPRYADAFWRYFESFDRAHPPYAGVQWMNGQEVALRLLALVWADAVFADALSSTPARRARLAASVAAHAARIPPTLIYARAQDNNHLLSEAAALVTAARVLPEHPAASRWKRLGRFWFDWGLRTQFDPQTGEYIQHSLTYHRLALQLALWLRWLNGTDWFSMPARRHLAAAAGWLAQRTDARSGDAPNLGSNDGAYLFPLAAGGFRDFRPVAQAASRAFGRGAVFPAGNWDEMSLWFGLPLDEAPSSSPSEDWRFTVRLAQGNLRLAHADLLHTEIWQQGQPLALDAGTYLYNGQPPWDNPWVSARFHNTLTVDGLDQMTRGGRFLYLDWARAWLLADTADDVLGETDAWRRLGLRHVRRVWRDGHLIGVEDRLLSRRRADGKLRRVRLHWLLRDAPFRLEISSERWGLVFPQSGLRVDVTPGFSAFSVVRGGELLAGDPSANDALRGWYAPTYGVKIPALSLAFVYERPAPLTLMTTFTRLTS